MIEVHLADQRETARDKMFGPLPSNHTPRFSVYDTFVDFFSNITLIFALSTGLIFQAIYI